MPSFADLVGHPQATNDPTNQMSDNPAGFIDKGVGDVVSQLMQMPAAALSLIGQIITDPNLLGDIISGIEKGVEALIGIDPSGSNTAQGQNLLSGLQTFEGW